MTGNKKKGCRQEYDDINIAPVCSAISSKFYGVRNLSRLWMHIRKEVIVSGEPLAGVT